MKAVTAVVVVQKAAGAVVERAAVMWAEEIGRWHNCHSIRQSRRQRGEEGAASEAAETVGAAEVGMGDMEALVASMVVVQVKAATMVEA